MVTAATLAGNQGCRPRPTDTAVDVSSLPSELLPLPGAHKASAHTQPEGSVWVHYDLIEPYPAEATLRAIRERLASLGWSPLAYDWLNPTIPSSHTRGWTDFFDGAHKPKRMVDQWLAQWQKPSGELVLYELRYDSPGQSFSRDPDRPTDGPLHVTGMLASAVLVKTMVAEMAARTLPEK
jgi:hypothetical protein